MTFVTIYSSVQKTVWMNCLPIWLTLSSRISPRTLPTPSSNLDSLRMCVPRNDKFSISWRKQKTLPTALEIKLMPGAAIEFHRDHWGNTERKRYHPFEKWQISKWQNSLICWNALILTVKESVSWYFGKIVALSSGFCKRQNDFIPFRFENSIYLFF